MTKINPAVVRILLRYLAAFLVSYGIFGAADAERMSNDPVVVEAATAILGTLLAAGTELFYGIAKRRGWRL